MSVSEHLHWLQENHPDLRVLSVACYGSQNYGLSTPQSDTDTIAFLSPTWSEVCLNESWYSKQFDLPNGEKCRAADFRHLIRQMRRGSLNVIEALYSDYFEVTPMGLFLWDCLENVREEIVKGYAPRIMRAAYGQAKTCGDLKTSKDFANLVRLCYFVQIFSKDFDFKAAIHPDTEVRQLLMDYRYNPPPYLSQRATAELFLANAKEVVDRFMDKDTGWVQIDLKLDSLIKGEIGLLSP